MILTTSLDDFLKTIATLRSPEGCSWDRKQTHESLIKYLDEEGAEVVDAIYKKDSALLKEELGDLLLQIALHAQIAKESAKFDFYDVIQVINEKMIRRHPHVFSTVQYKDEIEQKNAWETIKNSEKGQGQALSILDKAKQSLSGLKYANALQTQAATVGFDWDDSTQVFAKIEEELQEVSVELKRNRRDLLEAEIGDLIFAIVNLARHHQIDVERALSRTNDKFTKRFHYIERVLNHDFEGQTLESLDRLWNQAKKEMNDNE